MAIAVDYGAGRVVYDVEASEAFTNPTSETVQDRADITYGYLLDLEATADAAAEAALETIETLRNFSATVPAVIFNAPSAPSPTPAEMPDMGELELTYPTVTNANFTLNFDYDTENAFNQSWDAPDLDPDYTIPDVPGLTVTPSLPITPEAYTFPDIAVPDYNIAEFVADDLLPPTIGTITADVDASVTISPFEVDVETDGLLAKINEMSGYNPEPPTLPEYTYLIPEVFTVIGAMANGTPVVDYLSLTTNRNFLTDGTRGSTFSSFSRRGLEVPDGSQEYDAWLEVRNRTKMDLSDDIYEERVIDECVKASYQLGVAAQRMLTDIEVSIYDLEFQLARASVEGQIQRVQALAAVYQAEVLLLNTQIAEYNVLVADVEADARAFEAEIAAETVVGRTNALQADIFDSTERAKLSQGEAYAARVGAERTKLQQYRAVIDIYRANVAEAEVALADYAGKAARYGAEVDRIATDYEVYSAQAQATQFDNSARAAVVAASGDQLRSYASEAQASAAQAAAAATDLQAKNLIRETGYLNRALRADEQGTKYRRKAAKFRETVGLYTQDLRKRTVELTADADIGQVVTRYVTQAQDAMGRAANLSQAANIDLAQAYQTVYDAAGRAGAAVASGKLSGFRASATLGAREALAASNSYTTRYQGFGSNSYSESDNYT